MLLSISLLLIIRDISRAPLFLPKRGSAERWGVKLRGAPRLVFVGILLNICDISIALLFLSKRSTKVCYIVEYQQCKKALLFLSKRSSAERWGVKLRIASGVWELSLCPRLQLQLKTVYTAHLLFSNLTVTVSNSSVTAWQLLFISKRSTQVCYNVEYRQISWVIVFRTPQSLRDSSSLSQRGAPRLVFVDMPLSFRDTSIAPLFLSKEGNANERCLRRLKL